MKVLGQYISPISNIKERELFKYGPFQIAGIDYTFNLPGNVQSETITRIVLERGDSVALVIEDRATHHFWFVNQIRIPTISAESYPWILELVAGIHDQDGHDETALKELEEELGFSKDLVVRVEAMSIVAYSSPGIMTERVFYYYVLIDSSRAELPPEFGGVCEESEYIQRLSLSRGMVLKLLKRGDFKDTKIYIGLQWWLLNKAPWWLLLRYRFAI